jgi:hypothetical protein
MKDIILRDSRNNMQALNNLSQVFAYIFAWANDDNEQHFKRVLSMLRRNEIWEVMLALEILQTWIGDVFNKDNERKKYDRNETD